MLVVSSVSNFHVGVIVVPSIAKGIFSYFILFHLTYIDKSRMEQLEQKKFTTSRGLEYTYYHKPTTSSVSRPTLLLQHGFPDDHSV